MRAVRVLLGVLVIAVSAMAAIGSVFPRLKCNVEKVRITADLNAIADDPDYRRVPMARELGHACRKCLDKYPNDYHLQFLMARSERLSGQIAEAEQSMRRAIELNARPEFYTFLGVLQFERGAAEEGRRNVLTAGMFSLRHIESVSEPLHSEVIASVQKRNAQLRARKPPR